MSLELLKNYDGKYKWEILYQKVKDFNYNDFFSYEKLRLLTGFNIKNERTIIYRTNKELLKNNNKVLICERKKGYKIALPLEQFNHAKERKIRARRQIDWGTLETNGINTKNLSNDEKLNLIHWKAYFGHTTKLLRKRNIERLEKMEAVVKVQKKAIVSQKKDIAILDDLIKRIETLENNNK